MGAGDRADYPVMIGLRHCGQRTLVIDTREARDYTRRRRECAVCHLRFTTHEVLEVVEVKPPKPPPVRKERVRVIKIKQPRIPRNKKLPELAVLIELYEKPMSLRSIGKLYGANAEAVRLQFKKAGYKLRPKGIGINGPRPPKAPWQPKPIGCDRCETDHYSRGLCRNCYARAERRGELDRYPKMSERKRAAKVSNNLDRT